jgi:hypothetical protein
MPRPLAPHQCDANDPLLTWKGLKSRSAAVFRRTACYCLGGSTRVSSAPVWIQNDAGLPQGLGEQAERLERLAVPADPLRKTPTIGVRR